MTAAYQQAQGGYNSGNAWGNSGYTSGGGFGSAGQGYGRSSGMGDIVSNWGGGKGLVGSYSKGVNDTDKAIASGGGAAMAGLAVKGLGLKAIGGAVALGASSSLIGVAAIAAGGAIGATLLAHNSKPIAKGLANGGKMALRAGGNFLKGARNAVAETHRTYKQKSPQKSEHLEKIDARTKQREERFTSFVKSTRGKMVQGKDVKSEIKQMHELKIPTRGARKQLNNLTADYFIANNKKDGKLDVKSMQKDVKAFAKDIKLSKQETVALKAGVKNRVEEHKDNFILDKKDKFTNLKNNKTTAKEDGKQIAKKAEKVVKKEIEKTKEKPQSQKIQKPQQKEKVKDLGKEQGR